MFRKRPWFLTAAAVLMGSMMAVGFGGGCYTLGAQVAMDSIQPCGIFNCTNGILNGAINPCGQVNNKADDVFNGCP